MTTPQLRAFLFDSSQADEASFVASIFGTWDERQSVCIIPDHLPVAAREQAIVRCDPSHVINSDGITLERTAAIIDTDDLAAVALTSGTTGNPQPVELSFRAMHSSADALYDMMDLDGSHRWLCALPPYYVAGLAIFARCWTHRSKMVFHRKFDIERVEETISSGDVDVVSLVAPQLEALLNRGVDLSRLYSVLVGGTSFSDELQEKCSDLGIAVHSTYGMTETWGGLCHDGTLFNNTYARVVDDEIQVRSGSLFSGYRHNEAATRARMTDDGYFRTGDRGTYVNDVLTVLGRVDDVINSGGVKVDPLLVEKVFNYDFPDWEGFIAASDHPTLGQCTTLFVHEKRSSLENVRKQLSLTLPSTHLPVRIAHIDETPRTDSGKLRRRVSAEKYTILEEHKLNA